MQWISSLSYYGQENLDLLDQAVPANFKLIGKGNPIDLRYEKEQVYMQAPIQKFYDTSKSIPELFLAGCLVMLELLAPNGRVVPVHG